MLSEHGSIVSKNEYHVNIINFSINISMGILLCRIETSKNLCP